MRTSQRRQWVPGRSEEAVALRARSHTRAVTNAIPGRRLLRPLRPLEDLLELLELTFREVPAAQNEALRDVDDDQALALRRSVTRLDPEFGEISSSLSLYRDTRT